MSLEKIEFKIVNKKNLPVFVEGIFLQYFDVEDDVGRKVKFFTAELHSDCCFVVEYPYVDKLYRDTYYSYFASKLNGYHRDCVRVSIFNSTIKEEDFFNIKSVPS